MASCSYQPTPIRPAAIPTSHGVTRDLSPLRANDWISDFIERIARLSPDALETQLDLLLAQNSSPHGRQRLSQAARHVSYLMSRLDQADRETGNDGEHTKHEPSNEFTEQAVSSAKLVNQSFLDFVTDAESQIEGFDTPNDTENFTFLEMSDHTDDTEAVLPDVGHKLISQLNQVGQSQQRGSLYYAITTVKFKRWFESTIQKSTQTRKEAEAELRQSCLENTPGKTERDRRHALTRRLAQGRKWDQLVQKFGSGILLLQPMKLTALTNDGINDIIRLLPQSSEKMVVLKLLNTQYTHLITQDRTDVGLFRHELQQKFPDLEFD